MKPRKLGNFQTESTPKDTGGKRLRDSKNSKKDLYWVKKNWSAIRAALELLYGNIDVRKADLPNNRHAISKMIWIVNQFIFRGVYDAGSLLSNAARSLAMGGTDVKFPLEVRGRTTEALFLASTLSRGLVCPRPTKEKIQAEELAAEQRLTEEKPPISWDLHMQLLEFIDLTFKGQKEPKRLRPLPFPSGKSCVENPAKKGGAVIALRKYSTRLENLVRVRVGMSAVINDFHRLISEVPNLARLEERMIELRRKHEAHSRAIRQSDTAGRLSMEAKHLVEVYEELYDIYVDAFQDMNLDPVLFCTKTNRRNIDQIVIGLQEIKDGLKECKGGENLPEVFLKAVEHAKSERNCKLFSIVSAAGKIRVPTMHMSGTVWAARAMTNWLMPYLKRFAQTKAILRNKPLTLKVADTSRSVPSYMRRYLFSADLAKSTDPISVGLARTVLDRLVHHIGKPDWWDDAVEAVISVSVMETPDGRKVLNNCGALMGLGPSWTVLCVLNAFAAWQAGAKKSDHAICGDDLIGLWDEDTIARYQRTIIDLGMANNYAKSFKCYKAGVFCERLVKRTDEFSASGISSIRIGEASGQKTIEARRGRMITDSLYKIARSRKHNRVIRALAHRTADGLSIHVRQIPGLLEEGGGDGNLPPNALTVLSYALNGPVALARSDGDDNITKLRDTIRGLNPLKTSKVTALDLVIEAKSINERLRREEYLTPLDAPKLRKYRELSDSVVDRYNYIQLTRKCFDNHSLTNLLEKTLNGEVKRWKKQANLMKWDAASGKMRDVFLVQCYPLVSETLRTEALRLFRRKHFRSCLMLLRDSWNTHIDEKRAESVLKAHIPIGCTTLTQFDVKLKPIPRVWDLTA
jgi:hypothetical protein